MSLVVPSKYKNRCPGCLKAVLVEKLAWEKITLDATQIYLGHRGDTEGMIIRRRDDYAESQDQLKLPLPSKGRNSTATWH